MGGKGGEGSGDKVRVYVNLHTGTFFFQQPKADNKWLNSLIWRGRPGCLCVCLSLSLSWALTHLVFGILVSAGGRVGRWVSLLGNIYMKIPQAGNYVML